jgi:hypothetical protein
MPDEGRAQAPVWVQPLLQLVAVVLVGFGVVALMTGEWGVAITDLGVLAIGAWAVHASR